MKPAVIILKEDFTGDLNLLMQDCEKANQDGMPCGLITLGDDIPREVKYVFTIGKWAGGDLKKFALNMRDSGVLKKEFDWGTICFSSVVGTERGNVAVVLTCHDKYLKWLPECVRSINAQLPQPSEKILVLDGVQPVDVTAPLAGWKIITGNWKSPNPARDLGLRSCTSPWIIFFDADNIMAPGMIMAMCRAIGKCDPSVGFIYPNLFDHDINLKEKKLRQFPEYNYWKLRSGNYVDTSSAWRRTALEQIGGWSDSKSMDDYSIALQVTQRGWKGLHLPNPPTIYREHGSGRWKETHEQYDAESIWKTKTFTFICLLSGRMEHNGFPLFETWFNYLQRMEVPPNAKLILVDNSGNEEFHYKVQKKLDWYFPLYGRGVQYQITGKSYQIQTGKPYSQLERHQHVANLYAPIFAEEIADFYLTFEDDVIPKDWTALRKLSSVFIPGSQTGAIAAAYPCPTDSRKTCASLSTESWAEKPFIHDLGDKITEVGFVGGGFTLWNGPALKVSLPVYASNLRGILSGWDSKLCQTMRSFGWKIKLHEGVRCEHYSK